MLLVRSVRFAGTSRTWQCSRKKQNIEQGSSSVLKKESFEFENQFLIMSPRVPFVQECIVGLAAFEDSFKKKPSPEDQGSCTEIYVLQ